MLFHLPRTMIAAAAFALAVTGGASAHHDGEIVEHNGIRASHGWTQATGEMAHAIDVFVTIENISSTPDRLISATTDFTAAAVFQAPILSENGTLDVRTVKAIALAPSDSITFQPGGIHMVFNDVQRHVLAGQHFDMVLTFENAGAFEIEVEVEAHDGDALQGEAHDHDERPAS